jgi:hypothetical protein
VGALVGNAVGNPGAGAAIGAGVGALTGAVVGSEMDQMEARNRAMIAAQMGQQVAPGAVTINDIIAMTRSGVNEELILGHIQYHGVAVALQPADLIYLKQQGVSDRVVQAMQQPPRMVAAAPPPVVAQPMYVEPVPPPVVVGGYWTPGPYYYYRPYHCR